jgi:sec-independent protein translocase protein TatA
MFGNMGFGEIAIILLVILLLFGAKRIPEIAGSFGKGIREFKKSVNDVDRSIREDVRDTRLDAPPRTDARLGDADPTRVRREADEDRPAPKRLLS